MVPDSFMFERCGGSMVGSLFGMDLGGKIYTGAVLRRR